MNSGESGESGDKPAYEKALDKEAEDAVAEIRRRGEKARKAGDDQADKAAAGVRDAIRELARRLADETLTGGRAAGEESLKENAGRAASGSGKKKKKKRAKSERKTSRKQSSGKKRT